jgi:hypothetical protein
MKRDFGTDLEQLQKLAFRRVERCGSVLKQFHDTRSKIDAHSSSSNIWRIYDWLLVPFSLWPIDFVGFAKHLLQLIETNRDFDKDISLLLKLVDRSAGSPLGTPTDKTARPSCNWRV